jgi:hypothetical protein
MPDTVPDAEPIRAVPGDPEDQTPPEVGSVSKVVDPTQTPLLPAIGVSTGFTVIVFVIVQPEPRE